MSSAKFCWFFTNPGPITTAAHARHIPLVCHPWPALPQFRTPDRATRPSHPNLPEKLYFPAVAALFSNPASLPASLIEALSALEEMCHPECRRQMQTVLAELQFITPPLQNSITPFPDSPERFAIQAWLAFPALLA